MSGVKRGPAQSDMKALVRVVWGNPKSGILSVSLGSCSSAMKDQSKTRNTHPVLGMASTSESAGDAGGGCNEPRPSMVNHTWEHECALIYSDVCGQCWAQVESDFGGQSGGLDDHNDQRC